MTPGLAPALTAQSIAWMDRRAADLLRQRGLLTGLWMSRLAAAGPPVREFVNQFYLVPGIEYVLRDTFGDDYQRAQARLMMRFARTMAQRHPDFRQSMAFRRVTGFAPDGYALPALELVVNHVHYTTRAWTRLYTQALIHQFQREITRFNRPGRIRWVFDRGRLGMDREAASAAIRRILAQQRLPSTAQPWLAALDQMIVVV